jgi:hypothetical protein
MKGSLRFAATGVLLIAAASATALSAQSDAAQQAVKGSANAEQVIATWKATPRKSRRR